jgi:putative DNA primase/helicase
LQNVGASGQRGGPGPEVIKLAHATTAAIAAEAEALAGETPPEPHKDDRSPPAEEQRQYRKQALSSAQFLFKFGIASGNAAKIDGMLKAAAPYLRRRPGELDAHPLLLNLSNGTLELAGALPVLRLARREDLLTQCSPIAHDREASAPLWHATLDRILPDRALQKFIQIFSGYCLTSLTVEQKLVLFYGTGANGKSVLLSTISHVLGSYALSTPIETFLTNDRRGGDPTPDLARLPGARLVMASEPESGARLAESVVKIATGGDKMVARRLFEGQFEFHPKFKLIISANTRPTIRGQDEGIWRRVLLLPFEAFIPEAERDRELPLKLQAEGPGILNWMIDGWLLYQEQGLVIPDVMREATDNYRAESDPVREFVSLRTERSPNQRVSAAALYVAYVKWAVANALEPISRTMFGRRAGNIGLKREKVGISYYRDIALLADDDADASGQSDPSRSGADDDIHPTEGGGRE